MDTFPKFIIEGDRLVMGKVTYHADLVTDRNHVKGGGWFDMSSYDNTVVFSGSSVDFGPATEKDIRACIREGKIYWGKYSDISLCDEFTFYYHTT